jgi:hypothetical protein
MALAVLLDKKRRAEPAVFCQRGVLPPFIPAKARWRLDIGLLPPAATAWN